MNTSTANSTTTLNSSSAAMGAATGATAAGQVGEKLSQQEVDINALLHQMKNIEGDREQLLKQVEILQQKIGKLTEGKKAEMQKALDTVISEWLVQSVDDETVREEFKKGMSRLVDQTAEESGVWRVVCCASNTYAKKLQEIENMRIEMEGMRKTGSSVTAGHSDSNNTFANDNNRKRTHEQISSGSDSGINMPSRSGGEDRNIWEEFAENMKGRSFDIPL